MTQGNESVTTVKSFLNEMFENKIMKYVALSLSALCIKVKNDIQVLSSICLSSLSWFTLLSNSRQDK